MVCIFGYCESMRSMYICIFVNIDRSGSLGRVHIYLRRLVELGKGEKQGWVALLENGGVKSIYTR